MAKIEVNKFLASSKDNFLVFANDNYAKPMVTFYITSMGSGDGKIHIKDALNDDGFEKDITYSPNEIISDSTFKFTVGDNTANTFALLECLRKNSIFYDITLITDNPNYIMLKAYIDSSTRYVITTDDDIVVGGNYISYIPKEPNKFVLMLNDGTNQVMLDKYTTASDVGFNVTAPYEHLSYKFPKNIKMAAYHIDNNNVIYDSIGNNDVYVLPTTLSKFGDVNYNDYFYTYDGQRVKFLTNNFYRYYNYGELCGLSILSDKNCGIIKKYYTLSGKYLGMDSTYNDKETSNMRQDFYFELDISGIEASTNKQVGYVQVYGTHNGTEITYPIRFDMIPKCNDNNEIFFVNEIGGVDSFNFLGERKYKSKIKNQTTYMRNPTRAYGDTKELEIVGGKKNDIDHTLNTTIINKDTALWLNELSKSKYAFLYNPSDRSKFERIIVTDVDINISDRENVFEIELTYKNGDNNIKL